MLVEVLQQCKHVHKLVCGAAEAHASAPVASQVAEGEVQGSSSSGSTKKVAELATTDSLSVLEKVSRVQTEFHRSLTNTQVAEAAHDKCADILGLRSQSTCRLPLLQFTCLFDDCVKFVGTTDRLADKQVSPPHFHDASCRLLLAWHRLHISLDAAAHESLRRSWVFARPSFSRPETFSTTSTSAAAASCRHTWRASSGRQSMCQSRFRR